MAKLQFYCQFQFSAQVMIGVVLAGRMALCEKLGFFCSGRSLAVCLTKKSLLHKFILGRPQDILNFFVFRLIKVSGWVLLCQEGEGHRISSLDLELSALQALRCCRS